jgi:allophanate hydrolase
VTPQDPVGVDELRAELLSGRTTPEVAVRRAYEALAGLEAVVIEWVPEQVALAMADADPRDRPLGGVPFVVKDNIDVAGVATTAGCAAYSYMPDASATAVRRLIAAGAIPVAKTNLDQFATGLVGTRSPYGTPPNPFDRRRVPGGSSSGSAVAVACGAVPFALGTDTAGSGRVPAAFTGTVGLKPTRGWVSTQGVVPAVRTIDCVSVFALSVSDAWTVLGAAAGFDAADPFSRPRPSSTGPPASTPRVGVPRDVPVDTEALNALAAYHPVEVDVAAFLEAGRLLYGGPWVAERLAVVGDFLAAEPGGLDPTVREIILGAARWSAADMASAGYELARLRRLTEAVWDRVDVLVLPTVPGHPTIADVAADPIGVNADLGRYTTFANLLDLCAVAVPVGLRDGLPVGVCVVAPAWSDETAAMVAAGIHVATGGLRGATGSPLLGSGWDLLPPGGAEAPGGIDLAVVGAHLAGQPLHPQLVELGARLVATTTTAPDYRLYAIPGTDPPKPGLVRVADGTGERIEIEVYRLEAAAFGRFVAAVPPPLCIGTVRTTTGPVAGFLCEPLAMVGALDITEYRGWRAYRAGTGRRP